MKKIINKNSTHKARYIYITKSCYDLFNSFVSLSMYSSVPLIFATAAANLLHHAKM